MLPSKESPRFPWSIHSDSIVAWCRSDFVFCSHIVLLSLQFDIPELTYMMQNLNINYMIALNFLFGSDIYNHLTNFINAQLCQHNANKYVTYQQGHVMLVADLILWQLQT